MRLLLDTHTFLWFIAGSAELSAIARALIEDPTNESFLSIASAWEMAIKASLGRLTLAQPLEQLLPAQLAANGISILPIGLSHTFRVSSLPLHHRDPFDRMLVAQSLVEQMPLVSVDAALDAYGIRRLW
jgi:PIN domain nuclease of toxin-antitoxin system